MMLDHILATVRAFENLHGIAPNVVYLNPCHGLLEPNHGVYPGFRLIIRPSSRMPALRPHTQAA